MTGEEGVEEWNEDARWTPLPWFELQLSNFHTHTIHLGLSVLGTLRWNNENAAPRFPSGTCSQIGWSYSQDEPARGRRAGEAQHSVASVFWSSSRAMPIEGTSMPFVIGVIVTQPNPIQFAVARPLFSPPHPWTLLHSNQRPRCDTFNEDSLNSVIYSESGFKRHYGGLQHAIHISNEWGSNTFLISLTLFPALNDWNTK